MSFTTQFGEPAGVATTTIGGTPTADSSFVEVYVVPEPGTLVLVGLALVFGVLRLRRG